MFVIIYKTDNDNCFVLLIKQKTLQIKREFFYVNKRAKMKKRIFFIYINFIITKTSLQPHQFFFFKYLKTQ
jgi:hypothetical protein